MRPKVPCAAHSRRGLPLAAVCASLSILGFASAIAQGQAPVINAPRTPNPGDTRTVSCSGQAIVGTYTANEGGLRCSVLKAQSGQPIGTQCVTPEGNTVRRNTAGIGSTAAGAFNPHSGIYSFPLFVGKEWTHSYTFTNQASGRAIMMEKRAKVVSYERVLAGGRSFEAFKVDEQIFPGGGRPFTETHYYAPDVGEVKMESTIGDHCELLDYSWKR